MYFNGPLCIRATQGCAKWKENYAWLLKGTRNIFFSCICNQSFTLLKRNKTRILVNETVPGRGIAGQRSGEGF